MVRHLTLLPCGVSLLKLWTCEKGACGSTCQLSGVLDRVVGVVKGPPTADRLIRLDRFNVEGVGNIMVVEAFDQADRESQIDDPLSKDVANDGESVAHASAKPNVKLAVHRKS